jgi:DNA polymerase-3 subunit gamma/tau
MSSGGHAQAIAQAVATGTSGAEVMLRAQPQRQAPPEMAPGLPVDFEALIALFTEKREAVLAAALSSAVHLVHYEIGRVEFRADAAAPNDLAPRMSRLLGEWTGRPWLVSLSREPGAATLREQNLEREIKRKQDAANHPLVQAVLMAFPGATIEVVRDLVEPDVLEPVELAEPESGNGDEE